MEMIANHTIGKAKEIQQVDSELNIIDLGIIPINLQMIKKDVGLFNIFLNSSLYNEYLKNLDLSESGDKFEDIETQKGLF